MENAILVVGSVALDSVSTPAGEGQDCLGGSAVYFSLAASLFSPIRVVGVVGEDFPEMHRELLRRRGVDITGLRTLPGKTFRWSGRYGEAMADAETLSTELNVYRDFEPELLDHHRRTPYLFLANIDPELQVDVLAQVERPRLVACDTMNCWIEFKRATLKELLGRVDILFVNETESRALSGHSNTLAAARTLASWGPSVVVVKKGENGCLLFANDRATPVPAFPVASVQDPTGAGDSFAGGFLGYLASRGAGVDDPRHLHRAAMVGSVLASFGIEGFGTRRFEDLSLDEVTDRYDAFARLMQVGPGLPVGAVLTPQRR
jgi:sugar/nucleoside kinase (ribokinase family)